MNDRQSVPNASGKKFESLLKAALLIAVVVTLTSSSGCRSRCQSCGAGQYGGAYNGAPGYNPAIYGQGAPNPAIFNQGGSASRNNAAGAPSLARNSTTIAPPPTYSLNIPGRGPNPYAQGARVGQLPPGLINTRQAAPTPAGGANSPANFNQQQGWRQINGGNLNTQSSTNSTPSNDQVSTSVLASARTNGNSPNTQSSQEQQNLVPNNRATDNRVRSNNVATTRSTDYQSTSVDERLDSTRLPVTDASGMSTRIAQGYAGSTSQPYYNRQQATTQQQQAQLAANTTQQNPSFQGQFSQPVNSAYQQGQFSNPVASVGGQFTAPATQPQLVQSQSTAFYDPFTATASDSQNFGSNSRSY